MGSEIPKQFLILKGEPILMHTIRAFYNSNPDIKIIITLPEEHIPFWKDLIEKYDFQIDHTIVPGGNTRFQSVSKGLNEIKNDGLVAIHDGVRPLVSASMINLSYSIAEKKGSAVAAVSLKESIRFVKGDTSKSLNRSEYRLIQTPQSFKISLIKKAYDAIESAVFTDDASVFEFSVGKVHLYEGDYKNLKITTSEDISLAEALLE